MSPVEIVAVVFGLLCVWLTTRQNVWCWPTGLVQVVLFVYVFFQAGLYSDVLLHLIYIVLQFYGWYHWLHGGRDRQPPPVTRLARAAAGGWAVVAVLGTGGLGSAMARLPDSALPYWDAAIAVLSLIAQYLLARKVLENWLIWIAVDVLAVGVYTAKGLYLTAGLYAVFLGLATLGYVAWKRAPSAPAPA
jgi:nicotinamide mononucleotide transporter